MKYTGPWALIIGLTFFSCNQSNQVSTSSINQNKNKASSEYSLDKSEIENLIRQVLKWADSKNSINLLPVLIDKNNKIYIGFDLNKHKENLNRLKITNLFSSKFIANYNQIILALDKGMRNGYYEQWLVGDLPTFIFANDHSPWCMCQDSFDWNTVEVKIISLNSERGELFWYWRNLEADTTTSSNDLGYKFRVVKEDNRWKIDYLQGFDFKESIRRDGQL